MRQRTGEPCSFGVPGHDPTRAGEGCEGCTKLHAYLMDKHVGPATSDAWVLGERVRTTSDVLIEHRDRSGEVVDLQGSEARVRFDGTCSVDAIWFSKRHLVRLPRTETPRQLSEEDLNKPENWLADEALETNVDHFETCKVDYERNACHVRELSKEILRLRRVIRTGGAMYRAERACMGIPGGIDPDDALAQRRPTATADDGTAPPEDKVPDFEHTVSFFIEDCHKHDRAEVRKALQIAWRGGYAIGAKAGAGRERAKDPKDG